MNMNTFRDREARGYTLIEILVVVILIGILAAVGVTAYLRTIENNRRAQVEQTAQSMDRNARSIAASQSSQGYPANLPYGIDNFIDRGIATPLTATNVYGSPGTPDALWDVEPTDSVIAEIDTPGYLVKASDQHTDTNGHPLVYEVWKDRDGNSTCDANEYIGVIIYGDGGGAMDTKAEVVMVDGADATATGTMDLTGSDTPTNPDEHSVDIDASGSAVGDDIDLDCN